MVVVSVERGNWYEQQQAQLQAQEDQPNEDNAAEETENPSNDQQVDAATKKTSMMQFRQFVDDLYRMNKAGRYTIMSITL